MNVIVLSITLIALLTFALLWILRNCSERRIFPPGPQAAPIVGNILSIPPKGAWKVLPRLHDQHGDLLFFHGLGNSILILKNISAINELFDRRGDNYSHRPVLPVLGELMGLDQSMPMLAYGKEWREHRKLAHLALSSSTVRKYHSIQEDLASVMLLEMLKAPTDFFSLVRLYAERIILSVTYGLPIDVANNEYVVHAEDTMQIIGDSMVPGAFLCDFLPWMKFLPSWVPFQRKAAHGRAMIEKLVTKPFEHVKREMTQGIAAPSLTQDLLTLTQENTPSFENRVKWITGAMYGAGGETTYATILTFIMAMAIYPEKQNRAQEEIDKVLGSSRLPEVSDILQLPYVNAIIKETLRWHPTLPLGIARRTDHDDTYEGYFVPKGTVVMPNIVVISQQHSEKYDPKSFIPERFLDPSEPVIDPLTYVFGFGRRICPGKALAENSLLTAIAGILATFSISKCGDSELIPEFNPTLVSYPEPFECNLKPRSADKVELVERRAAQSKA